MTLENIIGVQELKMKSSADSRGKFDRLFDIKWLEEDFSIEQVNISINPFKFTLRGMHFQKSGKPEKKIMYLLSGEIFLSIVDLREKSPTYLKNENKVVSSASEVAIHIPAGCAAGWLSLKDNVQIQYLMSSRYEQNSYSGFSYNDPRFNIPWPNEPRIISDQDRNWQKFDPKQL
jgi:dTDP-4-dehydrorhamnose 3,5-epimerase